MTDIQVSAQALTGHAGEVDTLMNALRPAAAPPVCAARTKVWSTPPRRPGTSSHSCSARSTDSSSSGG
jgi:hypothetical protein